MVGKQNTGKIGEAERRKGCTRGGPLAGGREREKKVSKTQIDRVFRRGRRRLERSPPFVVSSPLLCLLLPEGLPRWCTCTRSSRIEVLRTETDHHRAPKNRGVRSLLPAVCACFPQVPSCDCLSKTSLAPRLSSEVEARQKKELTFTLKTTSACSGEVCEIFRSHWSRRRWTT